MANLTPISPNTLPMQKVIGNNGGGSSGGEGGISGVTINGTFGTNFTINGSNLYTDENNNTTINDSLSSVNTTVIEVNESLTEVKETVSTIDPNTILDHNYTSEINADTQLDDTDNESYIIPLNENGDNLITFDDAVGSVVEVKYTLYGYHIGSEDDVRSVIYEGVCSVYVDTSNTIKLSSNNIAELVSQIGDNTLLKPDSIIDIKTNTKNSGLQVSIKPNMDMLPMTWNIKVVKTLLNPTK
jgi:hypothetical protein